MLAFTQVRRGFAKTLQIGSRTFDTGPDRVLGLPAEVPYVARGIGSEDRESLSLVCFSHALAELCAVAGVAERQLTVPASLDHEEVVETFKRAVTSVANHESVGVQRDAIAHFFSAYASRSSRTIKLKNASQVARDAATLMEKQLQKRLDATELAGRVGVTPTELVRAFVQVTGVTPHRYFLVLRISHVTQRVMGGDPDLAKMATDTAFESREELVRAFKQVVGVSPSLYRASKRYSDSA